MGRSAADKFCGYEAQILYVIREQYIHRTDVESLSLESTEDLTEDVTLFRCDGYSELVQVKYTSLTPDVSAASSKKGGIVKVFRDHSTKPLEEVQKVKSLQYIVLHSIDHVTVTRPHPVYHGFLLRSSGKGEALPFEKYYQDHKKYFPKARKDSLKYLYEKLEVIHIQVSIDDLFVQCVKQFTDEFGQEIGKYKSETLLHTLHMELTKSQCGGVRKCLKDLRGLVQQGREEMKDKPITTLILDHLEKRGAEYNEKRRLEEKDHETPFQCTPSELQMLRVIFPLRSRDVIPKLLRLMEYEVVEENHNSITACFCGHMDSMCEASKLNINEKSCMYKWLDKIEKKQRKGRDDPFNPKKLKSSKRYTILQKMVERTIGV